MRANLGQGFLKRGLHLFGGCVRGNLRGHVVQMFSKVLGILPVLTFQRPRDDIGKVAVGGHTGGTRLGFKRGSVLLREINRQVHGPLLQVNPCCQCMRNGGRMSIAYRCAPHYLGQLAPLLVGVHGRHDAGAAEHPRRRG